MGTFVDPKRFLSAAARERLEFHEAMVRSLGRSIATRHQTRRLRTISAALRRKPLAKVAR